ncbi:MAG: hypothetical protein ACXVXN_02055 [Mycobacteriaceae bacterium]
MTEPNAITDDQPSPWWPCPECGGIYFRTTCVFERGAWVSEEKWEAFDPPTGQPSAIKVSDVTCVLCQHTFDVSKHYEWPEPREWESE